MYTIILVLIVVVSILLILVVLVQNSKGGGLASNFSSPSQMMGVKKTNDFIEKATWGLAIALLFLCLSTTFISKPSETTAVQESATHGETDNLQNNNAPAPVGGADQEPAPITPANPK